LGPYLLPVADTSVGILVFSSGPYLLPVADTSVGISVSVGIFGIFVCISVDTSVGIFVGRYFNHKQIRPGCPSRQPGRIHNYRNKNLPATSVDPGAHQVVFKGDVLTGDGTAGAGLAPDTPLILA